MFFTVKEVMSDHDDEIVTITRGELNALLEEIRHLREENRLLREENRRLLERIRVLEDKRRYARALRERQEFMSRNCASAALMYQ